MSIQFAWNPKKDRDNAQKHDGVYFAEAATVFRDLLAFIFDDEKHSQEEYRELVIGYSNRNRILIVSFTERDDVIRIISVRKADSSEREDYENAKR